MNHLGYTAAEVVNTQKLEALLTVGSRIFFQTHFYPLIKMQRKANEIFLSFKASDGKELPVLLNVYLDSDGDKFEIHCGGMQISQRNRFEKELLEAKKVAEKALVDNEELIKIRETLVKNQHHLERQLQRISSINDQHEQINKVLAHDLQEPLRKILFFASMLHDENTHRLDEKPASYLTKINKSANQIRHLIQSLQRYISLEHTNIAAMAEVNLRTVIAEAVKHAEITDDEAIAFSEIPSVKFPCKFTLVVSLFSELINNSVKFRNSEVRELTITIKAAIVSQNVFRETEDRYQYDPYVRITYTDNGIGFHEDFSRQAFELFRKLHPEKDGVGIGLAYSKKIVELHHGFISVSSAVGVGTTFEILFPMQHNPLA